MSFLTKINIILTYSPGPTSTTTTSSDPLSQFINIVGGLISTNIVAIVIAIAVISYYLITRYRTQNAKLTRNIYTTWQNIRKFSPRLTDAFYCRIGDLENGQIGFRGELYQIESDTYDVIKEKPAPLFLTTDEQIAEIEEKNKTLAEPDKIKIYEIESDEPMQPENSKSEQKRKDKYIIEPKKVIEKRKSITALAMMPHGGGGSLIAIRRSDLRETETIISEAEQVPLMNLDPTIAQKHSNMMIIALFIYEAIIMYMALTNTNITLLISPSTYPWYFVMFAAWYAKITIDRHRQGYTALYRGYQTAEESFRLADVTGQEVEILTLPIYELELHYHPAIPTKNFLEGIGKADIYDKYLKQQDREVTRLSTENSSLKSRLEQLTEIIGQKDRHLVEARHEHEKAFNDGLLQGYARYEIPIGPDPDQMQYLPQQQRKQGPSGLEWFIALRMPIMVVSVGIIGFYMISNMLTSLSAPGGSFNLFSTNNLLGMFLIFLILLVFGKFLPHG